MCCSAAIASEIRVQQLFAGRLARETEPSEPKGYRGDGQRIVPKCVLDDACAAFGMTGEAGRADEQVTQRVFAIERAEGPCHTGASLRHVVGNLCGCEMRSLSLGHVSSSLSQSPVSRSARQL